jgi:hypothetical protein
MTLSKPLKITIGILTLFAVLFPFVIVPAFWFLSIFNLGLLGMDAPSSANSEEALKAMLPFFGFVAVMMAYSFTHLGLEIFYIIHEIKNKAASETNRILFVLGTIFLPYVAMPIYYIIYVWKDTPAEAAAYPGKLPDQPAV